MSLHHADLAQYLTPAEFKVTEMPGAGFSIFAPFTAAQTIALVIHSTVWSVHSFSLMFWSGARMQICMHI